MKNNKIVTAFILFVTVTQINAKTTKFKLSVENVKELENELKWPPQRQRGLPNSLIKTLRILNKEYSVPIYLITNKKSNENQNNLSAKSIEINHDSRKSFIDELKKKYKMQGHMRTVVGVMNNELNKHVLTMALDMSKVPRRFFF